MQFLFADHTLDTDTRELRLCDLNLRTNTGDPMIRLERIERGELRGCSVPPGAVPLHIEGAARNELDVVEGCRVGTAHRSVGL